MKKLLLVVITALTSFGAYAQIPNNSFENWTTVGSYSDPDNWATLNATTNPLSVYTALQGSGGATGSGSSYLKLVSKTVTGVGVAPGIAASGTINTSTYSVTGGFPFTQQPQKLIGSWQYMASGGDGGYITVLLSAWNNSSNKRDTIAYKKLMLSGMAMSWANFTIPLTYQSTNLPDSALIIFSASGQMPAAGSYLYIDNISFSGSVAGLNSHEANSKMTVYPNPASNKLNLGNNHTKITKVEIIDVLGKVVLSTLENNNEVDLTNVPTGLYVVKVYSESNITTSSFYKN